MIAKPLVIPIQLRIKTRKNIQPSPIKTLTFIYAFMHLCIDVRGSEHWPRTTTLVQHGHPRTAHRGASTCLAPSNFLKTVPLEELRLAA
jgi:hypothetical protein